jgi:acyl-CoA thioesterase-1
MRAVFWLLASVGCAAAHGESPRVLLIGDSIAGGYAGVVVAELKGVAEVVKNPGNAGPTAMALAKPRAAAAENDPARNRAGEVPDPTRYETNLDYYLAHGPFDVIHFNWGLHDLKRGGIPLPQYLGNLERLVTKLQATGAKLIFATTTPVPPVNNEGRVPGKVVEFNAAAVKLMKEKGVLVDDLHGAVLPRLAEVQLRDNVHFGREGYALLGKQAAAAIREALGARRTERRTTSPGDANPAPGQTPATRASSVDAPKPQDPPKGTRPPPAPVGDAAVDLAKLVKFTVKPAMDYRLDYLKVGAIQHCDRNYEYSWIPEEMLGAVVFQGPHRALVGTNVKIEILVHRG